MKKILVWLAVLSLMLGTTAWAFESAFKITLQVTDETGEPIEGAFAAVGYLQGGFTKESGRVGGENKLTDAQGRATLGGVVLWGDVSIGASKEGYYRNWSRYGFQTTQFDRWQPWNPTVLLVLKKISHPTPMYAKHVGKVMPVYDQPLGYDLMVGDWTGPYGKGKEADLIFNARLRKASGDDFDYSLTIGFSNPGDGLQPFDTAHRELGGSELRSPYEAPEDGYQSEWIQSWSRRPKQRDVTTIDPHRNYFLRVRTVLDGNGKVVSALYGKIYGDFMNFTYYLNPDGTRNVEFDPTRNLLKHLGKFEEVRAP